MFVLVGAGGGKAYREIIDELRDWMGDGDLERELKPTWLMLVEDVFIDRQLFPHGDAALDTALDVDGDTVNPEACLLGMY